MTDTMYKYTRIVVDFYSQKRVDRYQYACADLEKIMGIVVGSYTTTFHKQEIMRGFERTATHPNDNWHNELKWLGHTTVCRQHYWKDDTFYVVYWGLERYYE